MVRYRCLRINSPGLVFAGLLCICSSAWADSYSACDINQDGLVNTTDVTLAVNMALGATTCSASVEGALTCTAITVQRIINASLGGTCITYNGHGVTLSWVASTSSNVAGYNVYRGTTSGGTYTKVSSAVVTGTSYTDSSVQAGQTYYYVATTVDTSSNESSYSNEATAVIPTP